MRKVIIILIGLVSTYSLMAGEGAMNRAQRQMDKFNWSEATEIYLNVLAKDPANYEAKKKIASCYRLLNNTTEAEHWYGELISSPAATSEDKLYYAQALRSNGKYDEADKWFKEYATAQPTDARVDLQNNGKKVEALSKENSSYTLSTVPFNSSSYDFSPIFYKGGVVFTSNRGDNTIVGRSDNWTGQAFYDIWYAEGDGSGGFKAPVLLRGPQPNRKFHDGPAAFSSDGNELYFTRNNYITGKATKSSEDIVKLKVFIARNAGEEWSGAENIAFNNDEYSVAHPALSADGKQLYFVSDMPGGLGETDIYVCQREGGSWSNPVNLGKDVNTAGKEMFPFISDEGVLYFSTDGRIGLGGLDVYSAVNSNGKWTNVQNLGNPINSAKDDFGFIVNKEGLGYFSSNREGGKGEDDIYSFVRKGLIIDGFVVDAETKAKLNCATVVLKSANGETKQKVDATGYFRFEADLNTKYSLSADGCVGYLANLNNEFSTPATPSKFSITVPLKKKGNIVLNVSVLSDSRALNGAQIVLTNKQSGEKESATSDAEGKARFVLDENSDYSLCVDYVVEGKTCSRDCRDLTTRGKTAPAILNETVTIYCEGDVVEIPDIYYDLNKYNIRPDAAAQLDLYVVPIMNKYPNMVIELRSHTDCRATAAYNNTLSQNRAAAAVEYLKNKGIASNRMVAKGYGESLLKVNCPCEGKVKSDCPEDQHQQNRRTEFKILKLK